jgi:hypothetical protein
MLILFLIKKFALRKNAATAPVVPSVPLLPAMMSPAR